MKPAFLVSSALLAAVALARPMREPRQATVPSPVRGALYAQLRARIASAPWALEFDSTRVRIAVHTSSIVRDLRYYWASYVPPRTADIVLHALAAMKDSTVGVVRGAGDWVRFLARAGWRAQSAQAATQACAELIAYAGPHTKPFPRAHAYLDAHSLEDLPAYDRERLSKVGFVPPRAVTDDGGSWTVRLWAAEPGRSTFYDCRPSDPERPLVAVDSSDVGILTFGM